jgi:hypothetical protein
MFDVKRNLISMKAAPEKGGFKRTKAYELINEGKIIAYKMGHQLTASTPITRRCRGLSRATSGADHDYTLPPPRTAEDTARQIIANGFRDGEGSYLTQRLHTGVWVSDRPLDENEGACGNALIRVELAKNECEIASFEWIEDEKPYREWLMLASLINEFGKLEIQEIGEEPNF